MEEDIVLQVKNLDVKLNNEKIINNLSFQVRERDILTILGPNGAGKTVLLKALLGLLPYKGEITWKQGLTIGYIPQGLTPIKAKGFPISVEEFFQIKGVSKEKSLELLRLVGIKDEYFLRKKMGILSSGQFQRLLIAWTFVSKPDVLLFDEPTTGIDIGGKETIYSLLHKIWKERKLTILLITHDLNIIYKYSNNVLCLTRKNISCSGQPEEILSPNTLEKVYGMGVKFYKRAHK